jgi:hypothetical protein
MSGCRCQAVFGERTAFPVKIRDLRLRFGLAGRYQRAAEPGRVLFEDSRRDGGGRAGPRTHRRYLTATGVDL